MILAGLISHSRLSRYTQCGTAHWPLDLTHSENRHGPISAPHTASRNRSRRRRRIGHRKPRTNRPMRLSQCVAFEHYSAHPVRPWPQAPGACDDGYRISGCGPLFGAAGPSPRWNIDVGHNFIRIQFLQQPATYGGTAHFTIGNLLPVATAHCGQPVVSGIAVHTNKGGASPHVVSGASFTPHSVTLPFAGSSNVTWNPGEYIHAKLNFSCRGRIDHGTAIVPAHIPAHQDSPMSNAPVSMATNIGFQGICPPVHQRFRRVDFSMSPFLQSQAAFLDRACVSRGFANGVSLASVRTCVPEPRPNNPNHARAQIHLWCAP